MLRRRTSPLLAFLVLLGWALPCWAGDPTSGELKVALDTLWVLVAGFLVFFMNTGFGCVEAGFCRAKNTTNILGKNFVVFAISTLAFWAIGWTIMFGDGNKFFGHSGWFLAGEDTSPRTTPITDFAKMIKSDIKDQFKLDLTDKETAKPYEALIEEIETHAKKAEETLTGDHEEQTYKVSLTIPVSGKAPSPTMKSFEKEYKGSDFYWGDYGSIAWAGVPLLAKFFFQLVFAGTAATIVSGCVAERIHYKSFLVFSVFIAAFSYPITGHWIWGGGWLAELGFWDFAGSTVVHSVGGWAGLTGILLLGPRLGKYKPNGSVQPIPGHSMALAFLGGMILWLGWFGFNPGSTMSADVRAISHIVITTNLACAAGMLTATFLAWKILGTPDFSMTVNGALAGLVAITAPCAWVSPLASVIIGLVAGMLVVLAVPFFDRLKLDDPVGALSVHLVNGIWGTLAVGLFSLGVPGGPGKGLLMGGGFTQLLAQLVGVLAVGVFTVGVCLAVWAVLKATVGLRVEREAEVTGLDVAEMGLEAYNGFLMITPTEQTLVVPEPRAADLPPNGGKRFRVVVSGVPTSDLAHVWSELCKPQESAPSQAFQAVYPFLTTFQDNTFRFRGGVPEQVRSNLEDLLRNHLENGHPISVRIEA